MRESEEYLESNIVSPYDSHFNLWSVDISKSRHAVKLAYKEGYLEALEDTKKLIDDLFGAYVPWEMIDFEIAFNKLKEKN